MVSDSLLPHELWPAKFLCPWNFQGKNTGMGCHFILQGIFPTHDQTGVSHITGRLFMVWATGEGPAGRQHKYRDYCLFYLENHIYE